jgi:hypothetical protein
MKLEAAVERFARRTQSVQDADLERAWTWGDYDEGLRYAFFRTYEELRDLAAEIAAERVRAAVPPSPAQHILGQYLAAWWDMQAALLGVDDTLAVQVPAIGEWPLRTVLLHILRAQRSFFAITSYAVQRIRTQDGRPLALSDASWEAFWAGDPFEALNESGAYSDIGAYFAGLHQRVLDSFAGLNDAELQAPSVFWESSPMPVRFRLHRFDAHMRQHTIQIDKARLQMGLPPLEAQRLLRLVFAALAEVQAAALGAGEIGWAACERAAAEIEARGDEVKLVLQGEFHARPPD